MVKGSLEFDGSIAGPRTPKENRISNDWEWMRMKKSNFISPWRVVKMVDNSL